MHSITKLYFFLTLFVHSILVALCNDSVAVPEILNNSTHFIGTSATIQAKDTKPFERTTLPSNTRPESYAGYTRSGRQLFIDSNFFILPPFGYEGSKCVTHQGLQGLCVRIDNCQKYYRVQRQINFYNFRQWLNPLRALDNSICSFVDTYGRANSGICCTNDVNDLQFTNGLNYIPIIVPQPLPSPPLADKPEQQPPQPDEIDEDADNTESIHPPANGDKNDNSGEFVDENNVDDNYEVQTPVTYDDTRYNWPTQFAGFPSQWPPALPTHPPSAFGSWPPPIPTHPPNHHYPTHPPSSGKPIVPTTAPTTTTRRVPTTARPTTTRRPTYPQYPSYPGFPQYPTYRPTYRPTTTTLAPVTTTSKPVGGGSSDPNGLPSKCGIKNPISPDQERIVGGSNASPHEFPWIAVLFKSGKQFCGGSLITKEHVLTAAHCVARMTSWDVAALTAHLGDYNIRTDFEVKHVERRIKRLVRHKGFDFSTLHNDIAILTLSEPVKFTYEIQPICLPTSTAQIGRSYSGHTATVAGWGSLRENGPQPSILQKVQIPIWTNTECARKYGHAAPGGIIESMICAGQASKDSCSGDSGGPLIINEGGRYTQVGIVSWGIGCGKGQYPGVYTRVTSLLPWIYKNIK